MATITWNGAAANNFWNSTANWDTTTVPTAADVVYFNATSVKDCTVNVDASFSSLYIQSTYTGAIDATNRAFTCGDNFWDEGTGAKQRNYGRFIRMDGTTGRLNFGPSLGTVTADKCTIYMNGTVGSRLDCSRSITFKNLTLGASAKVTHQGTTALLLSDTTCPLVIGSDASYYGQNGGWLYISLNGNGSYMNLPSSYYWYDSAVVWLRGTTPGLTVTVPGFNITHPGGASTWYIQNEATDRTFNIENVRNRGNVMQIYNSTASSNAVFNFNSDFTCAYIYVGCTVYGARATYNFGSGGFEMSYGGFYSNNTMDKAAVGDCTFNFSSSVWHMSQHWYDGTGQQKNIGTYSAIWDRADGTWNMTTHKPFYDVGNAIRSAILIKPIGDLTCHSINCLTGSWSNDSSMVYCSGDASFSGTGRSVNFGNGWVMSGSSGVLYLANALGTITSTNCNLRMDGTTDMAINLSHGATFKSFNLGPSAKVRLFGGGNTLQFTDTTCPFVMGLDSTFTPSTPMWLNLEGPGSYMSLPSSDRYAYRGTSSLSFRGSSASSVIVPDFTGTVGSVTFISLGDRTFNIGNYRVPTSDLGVRNNTTKTTYNFTGDVTCGGISLGNEGGVNTKTVINFGSGTYNVSSFTSAQFTVNNDATLNFSTSKWNVTGNWTDHSNYEKNPGTSEVTFTTNNAVITTGEKSFYKINLNGSGKNYSSVGNLSCYDLMLYNGNWSSAGYDITSSNQTVFNGSGSVILGRSLTYTGGIGNALYLYGTLASVDASLCTIRATNSITYITVDEDATFQSLNISPSMRSQVGGTRTLTLAKTTAPLVMGLDSTLTVGSPIVVNMNAPGTALSLPATYLVNGSSNLIIDSTVAGNIIIPDMTVGGTTDLYIRNSSNITDATRSLGGNLTVADQLYITNTGTGRLNFLSGDKDISANKIHIGGTNASGSLDAFFGSSRVNITTDVNSVSQNLGSNFINMYQSQWTVGGNWTYLSSYDVRHAWDTVTFTGDSTITSNSKYFNWFFVNAPSKTVKLADTFVSREYKVLAGTFNTNGQRYAAARDCLLFNYQANRRIQTAMPEDLYNLVNENPNLIAWYPFMETSHTTGYTPNVANQADGSSLRLQLASFGAGEYAGGGLLNIVNGQSGYLVSAVVSALQISTDLTIILEYKMIDGAGTANMLIQYAPGASLATNAMYSLDRNASGNLYFRHEYGSGTVVTVTTTIPIDDGANHFIAVRRDVSLLRYEAKIDTNAFANYTYATNPAGGTSTKLEIPTGAGTGQTDGEYRNVMIFNKVLTDSEVEIIRTNRNLSASWFDYSNWNSSTGTGYVTYK